MRPDIDKALEIIEKHKPKYGYYFNDNYINPFNKHHALNCSDEIAPGSNERTSKIRRLMHKRIEIPSENFTEKYAEIVHEIRDLMKDEFMAISDCSEREADYWIEANVNFNHVKEHVATDGKRYLSVDPKIGNKYVGFAAKLMESEDNE